jgi:arylsulfatase A-like enzyme
MVSESIARRMLCFLLACCLASASVATASVRRPNIIFVIADDMQRDMFNCLPQGQGKNLTPNLDRLASGGTLLLQQYVSSPVCTPSRYACLTGRYASRARNESFRRSTERNRQSVVGWNTKIMPGDATLPKALQKAGYRTGMVGKNHVVDVPDLRKIGYQADPNDPRIKAQLQENQRMVQRAIRRCGFDYAGSIYNNNPDGNGPRALAVHNLDWITKAGLDFITRHQDEPFFLYFASTVPHGPGTAERSWNADRRITAAGILDAPLSLLPPQQTIPERLRKARIPVSNNRANLLWLDDALGALLDKLREYGLEDDTIVIFFNDHGQKAKGTLYQGGINDPSIVWRSGGWACGSVCRTRVSNIDFAPTILDLAGATVHANRFDGKSFTSVLAGKREPIHESLYFEMGYSRAVIKGKWKYLALRYPARAHNMSLDERTRVLERFNAKQKEHAKRIVTTDPSARFSHISLIPGGGGAEAASTGKYPGYYAADQLYDLTRDPRAQENLANDPQYAGVLEEMQRELRNYLDDLPGGFGALKPSKGYREE